MARALSGDAEGRRAVAREIHEAARDIGFFYLIDHDVPPALLDSQLEWTRRFLYRKTYGDAAAG